MKLKVLFISSWFPNKVEPTNGNFVQRHAEAAALYNEVEVLHAIGNFDQKEKYIFEEEIINGIRTLIVYYRNSKNPLQNFYRRMNAYKIGFSKMKKPDLVHANVMHNSMLFAVYLKKKFNIPFVITEHWTALRKINHHITSKATRFLAAFIGNNASYIFPVSNDLKKSLKELGIKTPMKVIPNVVDTKLFQPENSSDRPFTFIHISNLIPRKNPDKIVNVAMKLLKNGWNFKLKIGGDGSTEKLREMVEKENLKNDIEIFESLTIQEVADKLKNSDCFILFSNDENQPCVIAESFASGLKVISTNVGGISEFFPSGFGKLIADPDEILLEKAMIEILQEKNSWDRIEIADYAKIFSKENIAKEFSDIYTKIAQ